MPREEHLHDDRAATIMLLLLHFKHQLKWLCLL